MTGKLTENGIRFLLDVLAGSDRKINGMYIEYGPEGEVEDAVRDHTYFNRIKSNRRAGYCRVAITKASVEGNAVAFTSVLFPSDLNKGKINKGTYIKYVTLANFKDQNPANDTFIYTADIPDSPVVSGASITVTAGMRFSGV